MNPATSIPGAARCASYQTHGSESFRCGSLARMGFPEAVSFPETTQLFEAAAGLCTSARRRAKARVVSGRRPSTQ